MSINFLMYCTVHLSVISSCITCLNTVYGHVIKNCAGDGTSNFTLCYPSVCMNPKILLSSLLCLSSDPRTPEGAELVWPAPSPARGQPFRVLSPHRQSPQPLWRPAHANGGRSCSSPWLHEPSGQWVTHPEYCTDQYTTSILSKVKCVRFFVFVLKCFLLIHMWRDSYK